MPENNASSSLRLVIADDHQIVVEGLKSMIEPTDDMAVVALCNSYRETKSALQDHTPDLLVTDLNMPGLNGVDMIEAIRKDFPKLKILVLTMYYDIRLMKGLRSLEVSGYLLKSTAQSELIKAIRTVGDGGKIEDPTINRLAEGYDFALGQEDDIKDNFLRKYALGKRELEILTLIGLGKSSQDIADALNISIETVHTHRKNIKFKVGLKNTAEITAFAIRNGLI